VLLALAAVAACGSSGGGHGGAGPAGEDCLWRLSYGGRTYLPVPGAVTRHDGPPLGEAHFGPCADSGGTPAEDPPVTVYAIPGVPPAEAVITQDDEIGVTNPSHLPAAVRALPASPS
jgi:hypothetical protein